MNQQPGPRLGYVLGTYPILSMTFVWREVLVLRALGFDLRTVSVNSPDRALEALTETERNEARSTYYLRAAGPSAALRCHLRTVRRRPAGYLRGWRLVLRLGGVDLRRLAHVAAYHTEALMVGCWAEDTGIEHLHAHLGGVPSSVAMLAAAIFGLEYSITVHGPDEFYDAKGQFLRHKVERAAFVVCISDFTRSQLMYLAPYEHWDKLEVVHLGVDPDVFTVRSEPDTSTGINVLCVGRLTAAKGQGVLLRAVAELKRRQVPIRLTLVGDGDDRPTLERAARDLGVDDIATFAGAVDQDRIRSYYEAAHIFCLPSFAEGIPVVLMEAMSMGLPCVTTRIAGHPELITDGENGVLVAPSNAQEMADAIEELAGDPERRERLGTAGRAKVVEDFNLRTNAAALADLFTQRGGQRRSAWSTADRRQISV